MTRNIPGPDIIIQKMAELIGERKSLRQPAAVLCDRLMAAGHNLRDSQLGIQRALDNKTIVINNDWTVSLAEKDKRP